MCLFDHCRRSFFFCFSFPDVYTQFRTTIEKQGVRVRGLINIPNTFKPLPDGSVIKPIPTLTDFGYSGIKLSFSFTSLHYVSPCRYGCEF